MSKIFYVKDENGTYLSADGRTRYTKLQGRKLYKFLKSEEGKRRKFHVEIDEDGECVGIETESAKAKRLSKEAERERYQYNVKAELKITITSSNVLVSHASEDDIELIQALGDEEVDVEADVLHSLDLETLRSALKTLTDDEYKLIYNLFLAENPKTQEEYANEIGVSQRAVSKRKQRIILKLKKFF